MGEGPYGNACSIALPSVPMTRSFPTWSRGLRISLGSSIIKRISCSSSRSSLLRPSLLNEGLFQEKSSAGGRAPTSRRSSPSEKRS